MTQCPICGQEIPESAARCESCDRWAAGVVASVPADPATAPGLSTAAPQPTASSRQWLWIPVVALASGAITLAGLMARADATPEAAAPGVSAPAPAPASNRSWPAAGPRKRWNTENGARWMAEGPASAAFELPAENEVPIWMRRVRPAFVVRCASGKVEAFVFTDSALAIEAQTPDHTVTIAMDGGTARTERWSDSLDHDALFAPDGAAFASALSGVSTLRVGYTPHNAAPVTAEFAVAGLNQLLASAGKPCAAALPLR